MRGTGDGGALGNHEVEIGGKSNRTAVGTLFPADAMR